MLWKKYNSDSDFSLMPYIRESLCNIIDGELQLDTSDNQFGFKKQHSTDLCIFTVKSVIKYYNCTIAQFTVLF